MLATWHDIAILFNNEFTTDYALVELNQLLTSVENVLNALETSGVQAAVESYRQGIAVGATAAVEDDLARASDLYMDCAAAYGQADSALVEKLNLGVLQSPSFWFDLTVTGDQALRLSTLAELQADLEFTCLHLPRLLALSDSDGSVCVDQPGNDNAIIKVSIHDAVEKASFPDRISRLIDGVDMIYQCCAELGGVSPDDLEVMSVTGLHYKAVVFKGHPEASTATRRIIRALYQQASVSLQDESYSVEQIAEQIPFMFAIDELFRVKALDADLANYIREGVLAGSIMLLECGVRIHGDNNGSGANQAQQQVVDHSESSDPDAGSSSQADMASDDEIEYLVLDLNKKYQPAKGKKK